VLLHVLPEERNGTGVGRKNRRAMTARVDGGTVPGLIGGTDWPTMDVTLTRVD